LPNDARGKCQTDGLGHQQTAHVRENRASPLMDRVRPPGAELKPAADRYATARSSKRLMGENIYLTNL
jgi:hypothetical protein